MGDVHGGKGFDGSAGAPGGMQAGTALDRSGTVRRAARMRLASGRLGRLGALEVRLARGEEITAAQRLRHRVFREPEAGGQARSSLSGPPANPAAGAASSRDAALPCARDEERACGPLDHDALDAFADHLVVVDSTSSAGPQLIACCRLLRDEAAGLAGGFAAASAFAVDGLLSRHPELGFVEVGRACVAPSHRRTRAAELLWHGIWTYVLAHGAGVLFGTASLPGTDPARLALPLAYLRHYARAGDPWSAAARPERRVSPPPIRRDDFDRRAGFASLPPLLKGYLRLGAVVGEGAVADPEFGTTDVLVVLPVAAIAPRYLAYYGIDAGRRAA